MKPMQRRLEALERQLESDAGSCLACALANLSDSTLMCDGTGCHLSLANLLGDVCEKC